MVRGDCIAAIVAGVFLTGLSGSIAQAQNGKPARYQIIDLGTLGGDSSQAFDVTNDGVVTGSAALPDGKAHAFVWEKGKMQDLGTLGGTDQSLISAADGRRTGVLAIASEISETDPQLEDFCGFGSPLICRAAVWSHGEIKPLPGLGGANSAALVANPSGSIIGIAEDGVLDDTCIPPQLEHFQAVEWVHGRPRVLPPLPGDDVAIALRNNNVGQVVGTSGTCANTFYGGFGIGPHAVLWDHGVAVRIGDLGMPDAPNAAAAINNLGQVFGSASVPDGTQHAFMWTRDAGIRDLGLLSSDPTDAVNLPFNVNDRSQMVGASCDITATQCRGYIWESGVFTDINTLLPSNTQLFVILPFSLNEKGQIVGVAVNTTTSELHAFLASPMSDTLTAPSAQTTKAKKLSPIAARALQEMLHVHDRERLNRK